jgi:hypothetical protein
VCLPNTPLTKNQRLEKKIKTMFGKHTLRTKYYVFSLIKIGNAKHCSIEKWAHPSHVSWAS